MAEIAVRREKSNNSWSAPLFQPNFILWGTSRKILHHGYHHASEVLDCFAVSRCNGFSLVSSTPTPQPTLTPLPSNTPLPTATAAPTARLAPTPSPEPSATWTITPQPTEDALKDSPYVLGGAGFKVRNLKNLFIDVDVLHYLAFFNNMDQSFIAYLFTTEKFSGANNVVLLQDVITWLQSNFSNLTMEDASPISVDGKEGLAANISGKVTKTNLAGTPFLGQVVMIVLDNNRIFVSVALGLNTNGKNAWKTDGQTMFAALLQLEPLSLMDRAGLAGYKVQETKKPT